MADLERIVGQKQIVIDFQEKMIELAEQEYNVDIKKKSIPINLILLVQQRKNSCEFE